MIEGIILALAGLAGSGAIAGMLYVRQFGHSPAPGAFWLACWTVFLGSAWLLARELLYRARKAQNPRPREAVIFVAIFVSVAVFFAAFGVGFMAVA